MRRYRESITIYTTIHSEESQRLCNESRAIGCGAIAAVDLDGWALGCRAFELVGYSCAYQAGGVGARSATLRRARIPFRLRNFFPPPSCGSYICTPGTAHKENVLAAGAAGSSIICEKPMAAADYADAVEMVETRDSAAGVPLFPAQAAGSAAHTCQ